MDEDEDLEHKRSLIQIMESFQVVNEEVRRDMKELVFHEFEN